MRPHRPITFNLGHCGQAILYQLGWSDGLARRNDDTYVELYEASPRYRRGYDAALRASSIGATK